MIDAQNDKIVNLTPPAAIVDDASYTVAELDTLGWDYCRIIVILGATDIAMTALAVTESDDTGANHGNVTGLIFGTSNNIAGSTSVLPTATDDNDLFGFDIDLRYRKRYLDLTATAGDGTAGTFAAVIAILSRGRQAPNTTAERGFNQILRV
jgi:hypothetical protein